MTENTTTISRRRLLARVPAMAATMAPGAATALSGLPTDDWRAKAIADTLDMLPEDDEEARKILQTISDCLKASMRDRANDAELLALKPQFDDVFDDWWSRHEAWEAEKPQRAAFRAAFETEVERHTGLTRDQGWALEGDDRDTYQATRVATRVAMFDEASIARRYESRTDEEIEQETDKQWELVDEILSHHPVTRDGLALQCRAMIIEGYDDWDGPVRAFVAGVAAFLFLELPQALAEELFAADDDEELLSGEQS
jgi:hypothetical protein